MNLKNWWASLQDRERQILLIGGVIVIVAIYYWVIFQPLAQALTSKKQQIIDQQQLIAWMVPRVKAIQQLGATNVGDYHQWQGSLFTVLTNSLKQAGLAKNISHMEAIKTKDVLIEFSQINFDDLMHWYHHVSQHYHLLVQQASFTRLSKPGLVKVSIVFSH